LISPLLDTLQTLILRQSARAPGQQVFQAIGGNACEQLPAFDENIKDPEQSMNFYTMPFCMLP
jgi:hypothetical protein